MEGLFFMTVICVKISKKVENKIKYWKNIDIKLQM